MTLSFKNSEPAPAGLDQVPRNDWQSPPWNRWSFQHVGDFLDVVPVSAGGALALPSTPTDLGEVPLSLPTLGDCAFSTWLDESYTDAILVWHRGAVITEQYFNGMHPASLHLSQSVAKSFTAAVAGILCRKGRLSTTALVTDYLPELSTTAYRGATVQHVLDMASGVTFDETYTNNTSDVALTEIACGWRSPDPGTTAPSSVWQQVLGLKEQDCEHGSRWQYRSIETDVLAFCMERATGKRLNKLVSQHLWEPMGAEFDGSFTVDSTGYALADGGLNASLRDYARFGLLYLNDGKNLAGVEVVPRDWVNTTRVGNHAHFAATGSPGLPDGAYKNQFWIHDSASKALMCVGVYGQLIYMLPEEDFMVVKLSTWPYATNPELKTDGLTAITQLLAHLQAT